MKSKNYTELDIMKLQLNAYMIPYIQWRAEVNDNTKGYEDLFPRQWGEDVRHDGELAFFLSSQENYRGLVQEIVDVYLIYMIENMGDNISDDDYNSLCNHIFEKVEIHLRDLAFFEDTFDEWVEILSDVEDAFSEITDEIV